MGATIKKGERHQQNQIALTPHAAIIPKKGNTGRGQGRAAVNDRAGKPDTRAAHATLDAFASVGAIAFHVTLLDIEGREQGFQSNRSLAEMRRSIGRRLAEATEARHSLVIRPKSETALLIQLDDFTAERAGELEQYAFLTLRTSPGNHQVWLAVADGPQDKEAAKQFRTRVRRGAGADQSATGATRIAGSLNFKTKYAPAFPLVEIARTAPGKTITVAELESAGLLAAPEETPQPPASVPPSTSAPSQPIGKDSQRMAASGPWHWPDYQRALRGAPMKRDGSGRDRSAADFMFCIWAIRRGHGIEETAEKLAEVSEKAQERIRIKDDKNYPLLTARNAAAAVERDRHRSQASARPR